MPSSKASATAVMRVTVYALRRRIITVDIAEIPLPLDQRITLREVLRQTHHRFVHRDVAMRMIFTDDVADQTRDDFL